MSKNIGYQPNYYINNNNNNSNENFLYNEKVNNQSFSETKDKEYPTFTPVSVNQQFQTQPQPQSQSQIQPSQPQQPQQQLPQQQNIPNINNMLNYEPDIIEENDKLKKPNLRKTYFKLPNTVSYRMKNKGYIPTNTNMNNDCNGNINVLSNQLNEDYNLIIRQQPAYARCSNFNDKERRPIDPPPIIQLIFGNEYMDDSNTNSKTLLHTSFFFMSANLVNASDNSQSEEENDNPKSLEIIENNGKLIKATNGLTVASLTRMKDFDSTYGAFFIFHDMSVCVEGTYRLKFSLYEISGSGKRLYFRKSILSDNFKVLSAREFPGMRESSPLVKLFAEQGLKIRIRKDKSLGKHPSKRIFVDLPGYDYFEKKKTTYIYVGKYPRYGFKETERNNSKSEIVFENETKKVINQNHDEYMKDHGFQNTPDNMYNKYMPKQDGYYGENDYNRNMRGPMGDNYRDMSRNNMIENRNKMNMKNYLNNEEVRLNNYDNGNYMPPGNRNNMNDQDMNRKGNMGYYEETQYSYYSEGKMKMKGQYMNNPPYPNDHRDEYKPNSYDKPSDYNIMPPRPYPNPPIDHPYMNDFNNKKMYNERRNSYGYNDDRRDNNEPPMNNPPPPPNMDRNDFYPRIPGGRNGNNEDYERFRSVKMEENVRRMSNPMYESKPDGNPPYNYPEGPINNDYNRKRKFNSIEDNYMVNNNNINQYYNPNDPRKGTTDDYDRMMARERGNGDYSHKTFYSAKEEETKKYIRRVQYYDDKRGNDYPKEPENGNYYNNFKSRSEMYKSESIEPGRPDNYNPMIQNKKPPYMGNDFAYRKEDNAYNEGPNGPPPPPSNKNIIRYNEQREDNPLMNYRRDYNGMPPNRQGQYDYNSNDYPNNPNHHIDGGNNYNYYSSYEEKRFSSSQEMNRFEPSRKNNINPPNVPNKDPYYPDNNNVKYYNGDNKNYYDKGNPDMYSSYLPVKKDNGEPLSRIENRNNDGSFKPVMGPDNYNYQQKPDIDGKNNPNIYNQGPDFNQNKDNYPPYPNMNENDKRNLYIEKKDELNRTDKNDINNYRPIPSNTNNKIKDIINDNNNTSNNDYSNSQANARINIRNVINE